jgi:lipopolysaccharide transport system ATP-binding protein
MNWLIKSENLSKKYVIGHQNSVRYDTFGEALTKKTKSLAARFRHPFASSLDPYSLDLSQKEEFWALKGISFKIREGDRIGIIGRNGAGKSTLLKILSRITHPSEGRIRIKGKVASLLEVGTGFHPELTGRENIFLNGALLGMSRADIKKRFDPIVDFAEVDRFLDTPVKRYSSGMYVRLAFAVAAHLEPDILIVDEVLAVGDVQFQKKCLGRMADAAREGRTILFVSHNMEAVSALTNRCYLLDSGRIIDKGATDSVISTYLDNLGRADKRVGRIDLDDIQRPDEAHKGLRFRWIETLDDSGNHKTTFFEGEPFCIRTALSVSEPANHIQIACTVRKLGVNLALFTVPSEIWQTLGSGKDYVTQLRIDPNFLRTGEYTLVLKAIMNDVRRDYVNPATGITIAPNPRQSASRFIQPWVRGIFTFEYAWSPLQCSGALDSNE